MQSQVTSIGAFVGGLNTEQPQLADQIQYTTDELNCQLLPDGTRARRYGLIREENSVGIPMSYTVKGWKKDSAKYSEELATDTATNVDTFQFDLTVSEWGAACTAVPFIQDGDDTTYQFVFVAEEDLSVTTWYMRFIKNGTTIAQHILQSTSLPTTETHFRFKVLQNPNDTTQLFLRAYTVDDQDEEHSHGSPTLISSSSDFAFTNYINVLTSPFTTDGAGEFSISDVEFLKDNEVVLTTTDTADEETLDITYNTPGEYKINITNAGVYTVWLSGGGATEAVQKSSRKFSYGYIYTLIHGSGGGAIKFYAYLTPGEYTVFVGNPGNNMGTTYMGGGFYYWNDAQGSSIVGNDINISAGGGSSRVFWLKEAREYSYYEGHSSHRGAVVVTDAPSTFTIASRTSDSEFSPNSGLTGTIDKPGAINQPGYFRITKGIISGNGIDEGENTVITIDEGQTTAYYWANYDKEGSDCIVLQIGSSLKFYEAARPYDSTLIAELLSTEMFIKDSAFKNFSFSSGEGFLLCTSEYSEPFYVTLDKENNAATPTPITLQIRDLTGVNDYLTVDDTPASLTDLHKYNLYNQGWDDGKINSYKSATGYYPSNALIWWYGKDGNGDFNAGNLTKVYFGTTPAPRGHYILDYFNQDRSAKSGISNLDPVVKNRYAVDSAFFAGRFFYLVGSTVLFSQIIREDVRNIGKCYQDADPTSQTISDIIATDGGEIIFQELGYGKAIKKFPLGLLAFGTKSVYAITSTSNNTFSATQYLTQFVTHAGCISGKSVVGVEDTMFYWSPQGIYQISVDQISGTQAIASSISADTIQSWYNNLPDFSKENCVGAYDYTNRRIVWLYPTSEDNLQNRDGVLVYYLDFKAFLPSKIAEGGQLITVFETILPTYLTPSIALFAGDNEISAGTNDVIVKDFGEEYARNYSVCYLGYIKSFDRLFFCDFYSRDFLDWQESMYKSYAVSYPITFGSTWKKQYTPTLQCYFLRTEEDELTNGSYLAPSSCYLSARWKWSDTQESDRWDLTQNAYIRIPRFMEFRYVNGKIRVRGSGPAVQYKIESKDDDDFKLSGMNMLIRTV